MSEHLDALEARVNGLAQRLSDVDRAQSLALAALVAKVQQLETDTPTDLIKRLTLLEAAVERPSAPVRAWQWVSSLNWAAIAPWVLNVVLIGVVAFFLWNRPEPIPPGPDPNPPTPIPVPPKPIPVSGLHVLILHETGDAMPKEQATILTSKRVRDYLEAKCVSDGKGKAYRIWDDDVSPAVAPKVFQDMLARPRASLPWIVIMTSQDSYAGPLPANVDETLKLLQKYGG